jgi:hypothetical protein
LHKTSIDDGITIDLQCPKYVFAFLFESLFKDIETVKYDEIC